MDTLTAKPKLLKQVNLSHIRKVIKAKYTATRAEIAQETKISSTTVRALLHEMMENGEIESIGYDESSGGRKAERYRFKPDRYYGTAFCIMDKQIHCLLINICGEILHRIELAADGGSYTEIIAGCLDELILEKEIKSIGIGVPGIIEGGSFWKKDGITGEIYREDIGTSLADRYKVPVVLENDLNATMLGFGSCYKKMSSDKRPEETNMAYMHFEKGCISAGFIADGRIIRGYNNFAGELGLIPVEDDKLLGDCLSEEMDDIQYVNIALKIITWICGILNPRYIILGGPDLRVDCIGPIGDELTALLPKQMAAEILYSPDVRHDYYEGMAFLTAEKIFDQIQFVKE